MNAPRPYSPRHAWRHSRLGCYLRARLQRRLFAAFGAAILVTAVVSSLAVAVLAGAGPSLRTERARVAAFAAARFASVWDDPFARHALAAETARTLDLDLRLEDARSGGWALYSAQSPPVFACRVPTLRTLVRGAAGEVRGRVSVCAARHQRSFGGARAVAILGAVMLALYALAGRVARRIARPLEELAAVVQDLGRGDLRRRAPPHLQDADEVGVLARAVNDMADRITAQISAQRELLAAVSHEIRSPLARVRFELEPLRTEGGRVEAIERELEGIDALVGDLLASARIDFDALSRAPHDAVALCLRAMERADVDASVLCLDDPSLRVEADASLATVALVNLLTNAHRHGGRVVALRVDVDDAGRVRFAVEDDGAGFAEGEAARAFEPFWRGDGARASQRPGVGLGLALVRRIAEVHGGAAWAEAGPGGVGARVVLALPRAPSRTPASADAAAATAP